MNNNNNIIVNYQTNANVIKQHVNESDDHNISMYDEPNGSFIDDMGIGDG